MVRNLYRDEINNPDNPTKLEKDFSRFENEASELIRRFREEDEIKLTREEDEKLKLFFAIMSFRTERVEKAFGSEAKPEWKKFYSFFQKDGNLTDFWKRNLEEIVNCRSIKEVVDNPRVDEPIKLFMLRDAFGLFGMHFAVAERRGEKSFILGDSYLAAAWGEAEGLQIPLYEFAPISPTRILFLVSNNAEKYTPQNVLSIERDILAAPRYSTKEKRFTFRVRKVYEKDVKTLNEVTRGAADYGMISQDRQALD